MKLPPAIFRPPYPVQGTSIQMSTRQYYSRLGLADPPGVLRAVNWLIVNKLWCYLVVARNPDVS